PPSLITRLLCSSPCIRLRSSPYPCSGILRSSHMLAPAGSPGWGRSSKVVWPLNSAIGPHPKEKSGQLLPGAIRHHNSSTDNGGGKRRGFICGAAPAARRYSPQSAASSRVSSLAGRSPAWLILEILIAHDGTRGCS